jgi:hypothetical protein
MELSPGRLGELIRSVLGNGLDFIIAAGVRMTPAIENTLAPDGAIVQPHQVPGRLKVLINKRRKL